MTALTCMFIGPSRSPQSTIPSSVTVLPPAAMGSVFRAAEAGFVRIAIVDGVFGNIPSVWHKEILFALKMGLEVWGAASMGALRAAELHGYGMRGVGLAYRLFRRGILTDDDEVCVIHAPRDFDYAALSLPMIDIRFTLRKLRRMKFLSDLEEQLICDELKRLHFSERTEHRVETVVSKIMGSTRAAVDSFWCNYVDVKRNDLCDLQSRLIAETQPAGPVDWEFPRTSHWVHQFERHLEDVPALGSEVGEV